MTVLISVMIIAGALLMIYNIAHYYTFMQKIKWLQNTRRDHVILHLPLILLVLFLIGYLLVAFVGAPDLVIAGILLGGSIFVFIITRLLHFVINRVNRDAKLEEALTEARRANQAKTAFLSNMSHDIRTPMNAIIGYTQLARRTGASPEETHEYLDKIDIASQFLLELINDILEMSRIESGKMELENVEADLCRIMSHVRNMFTEQMKQKSIEFTVKSEDVRDMKVICDEHRLNRVLMNLLSNAYKFTPEGGHVSVVLKQLDTAAAGEAVDATYEFRVKDDGIGMSPKFAEKIFEAFERERTSTDSGIQGTGLGMSITKSIVDMMDGTIRIDTAPGRGSEFIITLTFPLVQETGAAGQRHEQSLDRTGSAASSQAGNRSAVDGCPCDGSAFSSSANRVPEGFVGKRLLLVEDNEINREIAILLLREEGFDLDVAENGQIALDMVADSAPGHYAAVLMDIQMPIMNGYEATKAIRALPDPELARIPIIAMTANAFQEDIAHEREAGMDAHVAKPVDVNELMETLASILS